MKYTSQRQTQKPRFIAPFHVQFGRDAFLYMEPRRDEGNKFAQCGTCKMFLAKHGLCSLHGKNVPVDAGDSCGLYVPGGPAAESEMEHVRASVTRTESGFVDRPVRCVNCFYYNSGTCGLFQKLGLPSTVKANACCNAQSPR